jgi:hypothetical protein
MWILEHKRPLGKSQASIGLLFATNASYTMLITRKAGVGHMGTILPSQLLCKPKTPLNKVYLK